MRLDTCLYCPKLLAICYMVLKSTISRVANILRSQFVFAINGFGTPKEKLKARLVALGHLDKMKELF